MDVGQAMDTSAHTKVFNFRATMPPDSDIKIYEQNMPVHALTQIRIYAPLNPYSSHLYYWFVT